MAVALAGSVSNVALMTSRPAVAAMFVRFLFSDNSTMQGCCRCWHRDTPELLGCLKVSDPLVCACHGTGHGSPIDILCQRLSISEAFVVATIPKPNSVDDVRDITSPGVLLPLLLRASNFLFSVR